MKANTRRSSTRLLLIAAAALLYGGQAGAFYPPNGAKPDGAGGYMNPGDGACVIGVAANGTMLVDGSITNARDCVAWTKSSDSVVDLVSLNTQAKCLVAGGSGNDGYKHAWSTSICYDTTNNKGISRVDLDNTAAMCTSKGGTVVTSGKCVAYGWVYRNRKADNTLPFTTGTPVPSSSILYTTDGVQSTDNLGFCYASMDMTSGTYANRGTCPSKHNNAPPVAVSVCEDTSITTIATCQNTNLRKWSAAGGFCMVTSISSAVPTALTCTGGSYSWHANVVAAGVAPVGEWTACASNPVAGCQSQTSYDAGLGWSLVDSFSASITTGVPSLSAGTLVCADSSAADKAACDAKNSGAAPGTYYWNEALSTCIDTGKTTACSGTNCTTALTCTGGTLSILVYADNNRCVYAFGQKGKLAANLLPVNTFNYTGIGTTVDLSGYTNQGDCLAAGASWDNWLPSLNTTILTPTENPALPAGAQIVKLDATTPVESGGGEFFSGTGFNCLKCHSDQSRSYQERQKPGFVKTRHQKAGDDLSQPFAGYFTAGSSDWGLQGVICSMCHSTAKPARDDLIQVVPAGVVGPPAAGDPKSATGHNQTEYGAHLLDICYTCHGSPANPPTTNPASVIPVSAGDFALTSNLPGPSTSNLSGPPHTAGLAPIVNQFLNSPHARYTGSSSKVDIGNKNNYGSTFEGWVCRDSNSIGGGNILTTVYRSGVAEKIPNLDSTTNAACTNPGDGSATSGAAGFWVKDGETSPGVPTDTAQGNCMTCHDVHWALADTDPKAEPFRRECPTCHVNSGPSASGAPQIDLSKINHLATAGTPLEHAADDPGGACEICHMPDSGGPDSSRMHLWRINTDPSYVTMGASQANTTAEKKCAAGVNAGRACAINADCPSSACNTVYTNAAWVDIPHACGQCHGTDGITAAVSGVPPRSTAQLAAVAKGMHDGAGANCRVTFSIAKSGLTANVDAFVDCSPNANTGLTYEWDWGDSTTHGTADPDTHTYAAAGAYAIKLTVQKDGLNVGSMTRSVTLTAPDSPPTAAIAGGACTFSANTWTMSLTDASTDADASPVQTVYVEWGDGSRSFGGKGSAFSHTYITAGSFAVTLTAIDSALQISTPVNCPSPATPTYFTISGTVKNSTGANVPSAAVTVKKAGVPVKTVYTLANGMFSAGSLKPGTYTLDVTKAGYTFAVPAAGPITVGGSSPGNTINSLTP